MGVRDWQVNVLKYSRMLLENSGSDSVRTLSDLAFFVFAVCDLYAQSVQCLLWFFRSEGRMVLELLDRR